MNLSRTHSRLSARQPMFCVWLVWLVAMMATDAAGFAIPEPASGNIAPFAPTPTDDVVLTITDWFGPEFPASGLPDGFQIDRAGNQISVVAHWSPALTNYPYSTFQIDLGTLPVGQYTVTYSQVSSLGKGNELLHYVTIAFWVTEQGPATAVEYFSPALGHYFYTADSAEIAVLDGGMIPGWVRTGEGFHVVPAAIQPTIMKGMGNGTVAQGSVWRFYGLPQAGLNSHFFTADYHEAQVLMATAGAWELESSDIFGVVSDDSVPPTPYPCPAKSVPLYRLYNNRPDVDHRYTTSTATRDQMIASGWIVEGFGDYNGGPVKAMCAPE